MVKGDGARGSACCPCRNRGQREGTETAGIYAAKCQEGVWKKNDGAGA